MESDWVTIPEAEWETVPITEADWEAVPEEPGTFGERVGGAFTRGAMRVAGAMVDLPKHIVNQVKLLPMSTMADEVLATRDPVKRASKLEDMAKVEGFFNRVTQELGKAGELHRMGQEVIAKNHPEWVSEPPKNFVDLLTSPDKLVVSLAESTPLLLSAGILTAAGAPQVGVMMMYASEGGEAYDRAKAAGESDDVADDAYMIYGTVAAALEQMQLRGIMKIGKGMFNRVINRTAQKVGRRGARALTMDIIKVAGKEALEEVLQGEWGDVTAKVVYGEPFGPVGAHIDRRAQEAYIGFAMGVIPGVGGATMGKAQQQLAAKMRKTVPTEEIVPAPKLADIEKRLDQAYKDDDLKTFSKILEEELAPLPAETTKNVLQGHAEMIQMHMQEQLITKPTTADEFVTKEVWRWKLLHPDADVNELAGVAARAKGEYNKFIKPTTADEAIGKQYGLAPEETNERLGKAELRYRELKNKPVEQRTRMEKKEIAFLRRNRKNIEAILDQETKPLEKTMTRKKALALGHDIPKQLGWTEDQRKAFNKKITNQESMKKMKPAQRKQLINALMKEARAAGIEVTGPDSSPVSELITKLEERKQKPALTQRDRRNIKKLRKVYYMMKSKTNFYFLHMSRMKRLCRALDNYEDNGPFTRYIYQPVKDADTKAAVNFSAAMNAAVRTYDDLNIDVVKMFTEIKDIGIEDKLSTAERIGVWALAQNKKTKNHLLSEFTEDEINTVVKSVEANEEEMLVAAEIQTYFEQGWHEFKMLAERYGIKGIIKEENYITAFVKNKQDIADTEFMEGLLEQFTQGKFVPGEQHTKKRKPGARRELELNIFMIHTRAAKAIERFKVMVPVADNVGQMLKHRSFKEGINNTTYGHGSRVFDKWLQDSIRGQSVYDTSPIGQAMRWLRMHSVHYVLGAKILTAAKQGISLAPAMAVHPGMAPLILANIAHNPFGAKYKTMIAEVHAKSDMMRHRDWDRDLRQTYDQKAVKKMYAGKKLSPFLMRMATWVDRHTAGAVWYSAYQLSLKHGMNEKKSIRFADGVVESTQPMGKAVDLPAFFRGSELEKNLTIFQNQVNQNGNMLWYDTLGEAKARKISMPMLGYRLLMQQVVPALLLGMVSRGRLPEDVGDVIKDLAFYLLSPYFVVGRFIYNISTGEWGAGPELIAATPLKETGYFVGALKKGDPGGILKYGARTTGAWTGGYPPLQVIQTAEGAWNLTTDETDDFRELVWSKYALRTKRKKKRERPKEYYRYKRP